MIDLTPLDVRNKKGDFAKALRGYDAGEVDTFLDLVAERLEELVRENMTLRERSDRLLEQVSSQEGREKAVQEALVTAQELREEVQAQARKEAELIRKEAEGEARRIVMDAEREVKERREALEELERKRLRFLRAFRSLLERELDVVEVEEGRQPLEDIEVELDLGGGRPAPPPAPEPDLEEDAGADVDEATGADVDEGTGLDALEASGSGDGRSGEPSDDAAAAEAPPEGDEPDELPAADRGELPPAEVDELPAADVDELPPADADERRSAAPDDDLWLSSILQDDDGEDRRG